jgi:hypothetical protein
VLPNRFWTLLLVVATQTPAHAGDIAGMPASLPPFVSNDFQLTFSNDFLGRGGSVDDFRTQQIMVEADFAERWTAIVDHSVLTLTEPAFSERIDQLSASVGYRFVDRTDDRTITQVTAGFGVRSVGDFAGERMQNGFHRLIGSDIEDLAYSGVDETYFTTWVDSERYAPFHESGSNWSLGYWARARALVTSDGQLDTSLALAAVASHRAVDIWAGLRQDWRSGYKESVQRATADAEQDLAFTLGARFGSLVLETVQQFSNDASFGQLRLLSAEAEATSGWSATPRLGFEMGLLLPDVHLHLAGRIRSHLLAGPDSGLRESIIVSVDFGEPQYEDDASVFVDSTQVGIGLEWERSVSAHSDWVSAYGSLAAGWRTERLVGEGPLAGQQSESADSGVAILGAGLRFYSSALSKRWRYRIQTGLIAWVPFDSARLTIDAMNLPAMQSTMAFSTGVSFEFN